jgi:hypothetical protein
MPDGTHAHRIAHQPVSSRRLAAVRLAAVRLTAVRLTAVRLTGGVPGRLRVACPATPGATRQNGR